MEQVKVVVISIPELTALINQAVEQATFNIAAELVEATNQNLICSTKTLARFSDCSEDTVRDWINIGLRVPGTGKKEKLKIVDGLTERGYRVWYSDYLAFIKLFPRIKQPDVKK